MHKKFKVAWHELKIWKISDFLVSSGCSIFFHITTRVLDSAIEFLNQEAKELKNCGLNFKFESHREVLGKGTFSWNYLLQYPVQLSLNISFRHTVIAIQFKDMYWK